MQKSLPAGGMGYHGQRGQTQLSTVKQSFPGDRDRCILGAAREIRVINSQNAGAKGPSGFFNPMVLNLPEHQNVHGSF